MKSHMDKQKTAKHLHRFYIDPKYCTICEICTIDKITLYGNTFIMDLASRETFFLNVFITFSSAMFLVFKPEPAHN